ncbi:hypothetical protein V2J09_002378 [Rumex salicifolius]
MASMKESATPPAIGKIGPYTVFLTPRSPPNSPSPVAANSSPIPETPKKFVAQPPPPVTCPVVAPPVQPPPAQFAKPSADYDFGFLRNAISRVQNAHSSLDEYVANWLGLNQSKYQWALDDYYEAKELVCLGGSGRIWA